MLDKTGKLTQKYQAKFDHLILKEYKTDTDAISKYLASRNVNLKDYSPSDDPKHGQLISIEALLRKLQSLKGETIDYMGGGQERRRGAELQKKVCRILGYKDFKDDGTFPDIKNQLLEIKLQTSPTIDLGLFLPDGHLTINIHSLDKKIKVRYIRYLVVYAERKKDKAVIMDINILSGENFFKVFRFFLYP